MTSTVPAVIEPAPPVNPAHELRKASTDVGQSNELTIDEISGTVDKFDIKRSGWLAGFLGGAVGGTAGVSISGFALGGLALPATMVGGPLGMAAGVAIALLAWRGREWWRLEKWIDKTKLSLEAIDERMAVSLKQIASLPNEAPSEIRAEAWRAHRQLIDFRQTRERQLGRDWDDPQEDVIDRLSHGDHVMS